MFFKIVVLRKIVVQNSCSQESGPRKAPVSEAFLIKLQALRVATLMKRGSWEICKIFKNILFYWTSPLIVSDSFRFPVCNLKKRFPKRYFSVGFAKLLRTSFDRAPPDNVFISWSMNFVFFRTSFIEHLWETAYFQKQPPEVFYENQCS